MYDVQVVHTVHSCMYVMCSTRTTMCTVLVQHTRTPGVRVYYPGTQVQVCTHTYLASTVHT